MGRGQQGVDESKVVRGETFKRGRRSAGVQLAAPVQTSGDVLSDVVHFFLNAHLLASNERVIETAKELRVRLLELREEVSSHRLSDARVWIESKIGFVHATLSNMIEHWPHESFAERLPYEAKSLETKMIWWQIELEREENGVPPLSHDGGL